MSQVSESKLIILKEIKHPGGGLHGQYPPGYNNSMKEYIRYIEARQLMESHPYSKYPYIYATCYHCGIIFPNEYGRTVNIKNAQYLEYVCSKECSKLIDDVDVDTNITDEHKAATDIEIANLEFDFR